jgi:hypothetical protein
MFAWLVLTLQPMKAIPGHALNLLTKPTKKGADFCACHLNTFVRLWTRLSVVGGRGGTDEFPGIRRMSANSSSLTVRRSTGHQVNGSQSISKRVIST